MLSLVYTTYLDHSLDHTFLWTISNYTWSKPNFMAIKGMPGVVSAIDETHIKIIVPSTDEDAGCTSWMVTCWVTVAIPAVALHTLSQSTSGSTVQLEQWLRILHSGPCPYFHWFSGLVCVKLRMSFPETTVTQQPITYWPALNNQSPTDRHSTTNHHTDGF